MTTYQETRLVRVPRESLFDLVADVERYPEFLPLWSAARIRARKGNVYYTEQVIGLGPIRERFRTRTALERPHAIEVRSTDGLFRKFLICWQFEDEGSDCRVSISLTWEVRSRLLQAAIDGLLPMTARSMVAAFEQRAQDAASWSQVRASPSPRPR
jgi:coenzyme Q-binding protein COQ10